jgi:hypothetical protein
MIHCEVLLTSSVDNPHRISPPWYSSRLNSSLSVLPSTRSTNHEESQLSKPTMPAVGKSRCRKHHPQWLLQDDAGEESSIPLSDLREDVLFEHRDALPTTPAQENESNCFHGLRKQKVGWRYSFSRHLEIGGYEVSRLGTVRRKGRELVLIRNRPTSDGRNQSGDPKKGLGGF